jgi:predicted nuclease with TOPRIM domain
MGSELKTIENCENVLRNRKQKNTQNENAEKPSKEKSKQSEKVFTEKSEVVATNENNKIAKIKSETSNEMPEVQKQISTQQHTKFTIKIEFDPMSIALFMLAIATRFFRLSEPRNVV